MWVKQILSLNSSIVETGIIAENLKRFKKKQLLTVAIPTKLTSVKNSIWFSDTYEIPENLLPALTFRVPNWLASPAENPTSSRQ